MTANGKVDCIIFGGGIAGLWCLDALSRAGYAALLLSDGPLGKGQTIASQGIIHGGTKYTLNQEKTEAAEALAQMPNRWQAALSGSGETDLTAVKRTADHHLLWIPPQFASGFMTFFAGKAMQGRTEHLNPDNYPEVFQDPNFKGSVLALDEIVLDIATLLAQLAHRYQDQLIDSAALNEIEIDFENARARLRHNDVETEVDTRYFLFCAGSGTDDLHGQAKTDHLPSQRRPLRMVMLRHAPGELWAHCIVKQTNPKFTITTHYDRTGARIWYIGGDVAEAGAGLSDAETIKLAQQELQHLLPWVNFSTCQWACHPIDRVEGARKNGQRPDGPMVKRQGNLITAFPTKLAFAPLLADQVLAELSAPACVSFTPSLPRPAIADAPWDTVKKWS